MDVGQRERIDGVELGVAEAAASGDGLDRLAANGATLRVAPGRHRRLDLGRFLVRRGLLAAVRAAAAHLRPAFAVVNLFALRTDDAELVGGDRRLADRAGRPGSPGPSRDDESTVAPMVKAMPFLQIGQRNFRFRSPSGKRTSAPQEQVTILGTASCPSLTTD